MLAPACKMIRSFASVSTCEASLHLAIYAQIKLHEGTTIWRVATVIPFKVLTWSAIIQYESSFRGEASADPGGQDVLAAVNVDASTGTWIQPTPGNV